MRKEMKLVAAVTVICFIASLPGNDGKTSQAKTYTNKTYGFKLQIPADWPIKDHSASYGYLEIFSPEALTTKKQSLELITGLKIELHLNETKNDINDALKNAIFCEAIANSQQKVDLYCQATADCLVIYAPITQKGRNFFFIGYFPEIDTLETYKKTFTRIILSFDQLKSGSS